MTPIDNSLVDCDGRPLSPHMISRLCELVGLLLGDGTILYQYRRKFNRVGLSGDVLQDKIFFRSISETIFILCGKMPTICVRKHKKGQSLELYLNNKRFVCYLVHQLGLPYGKKTYTVKIPKKFLSWSRAQHVLRGLFESDGSLFFSKSKITIQYPSYPRIELRTVSEMLARQMFDLLLDHNFNVQLMKTKYGDYKVYLSGQAMLEKWVREIGFSNPSTVTKHLFWKRFGYYIPRSTFYQRKKLLKIENSEEEYGTVAKSG